MRSKRSRDQTDRPATPLDPRPLPHQVVIPSDLCAAREVEEDILRQVEAAGYSPECGFAIRLALEEAVVNAHKHGNKSNSRCKIAISYRVDSQRVVVRVRDDGPGFNPARLPDCTAPERLDLPCGRGIMLMHAYMDGVTYNEKGNEVQLVKEKC